MEALALFAICAVGTVIFPLNPELATIGFGTRGTMHPLLIGLIAATGQTLVYAVMFKIADRLIARWERLRLRVERVRERFRDHFESRYLGIALFAAFIGFPPPLIVAALASGFHVPLRHLLPTMYVARIGRLAILAAFGGQIYAWFGWAV